MRNLSDNEKAILIDFFNKKPNLENKIDWNNKNLSFSDFQELINTKSKREVLKNIKSKGIKGLIENKDYIEFPLDNYNNRMSLDKTILTAYIPLTYEASKHIASKTIHNCVGKWCTSWQKDRAYWDKYVLEDKNILIYVLHEEVLFTGSVMKDKYAFRISKDYKWKILEARDKENDILSRQDIKTVVNNAIKSNEELLDDIRKKLNNSPEIKEMIYGKISRDYYDFLDNCLEAKKQYEDYIYLKIQQQEKDIEMDIDDLQDRIDSLHDELEDQEDENIIDEISSEIEDLETEIEDLQYKLNNIEANMDDYDFYPEYYPEITPILSLFFTYDSRMKLNLEESDILELIKDPSIDERDLEKKIEMYSPEKVKSSELTISLYTDFL